MNGCIFNVQKYSIHDGPGIRTIVFLKGCPLHCLWCANPESQKVNPQIAYKNQQCIGEECLYCKDICPNDAISFKKNNSVDINFVKCFDCLKCSSICPSKAILTYGQYRSVENILDEVEKDASFYNRTAGGLTLSGGEPMMQVKFAVELLKEAKHRGFNTTIETSAYAPWEVAKEIFANTDYIIMDIKCLDSEKHEKFTGVKNEQILQNFINLKETFPNKNVLIRTPVIPGFNDTLVELKAIKTFIMQYNQSNYELLKYHHFGEQKYGYIGREYLMHGKELSDEKFNMLNKLVKEAI